MSRCCGRSIATDTREFHAPLVVVVVVVVIVVVVVVVVVVVIVIVALSLSSQQFMLMKSHVRYSSP